MLQEIELTNSQKILRLLFREFKERYGDKPVDINWLNAKLRHYNLQYILKRDYRTGIKRHTLVKARDTSYRARMLRKQYSMRLSHLEHSESYARQPELSLIHLENNSASNQENDLSDSSALEAPASSTVKHTIRVKNFSKNIIEVLSSNLSEKLAIDETVCIYKGGTILKYEFVDKDKIKNRKHFYKANSFSEALKITNLQIEANGTEVKELELGKTVTAIVGNKIMLFKPNSPEEWTAESLSNNLQRVYKTL